MPRLLDLFCGVGGASVGYARAGWEVVGVDLAPQPRYPFPFHQADALEYPTDGFDAIHASPPCQPFSLMLRNAGRATDHPDLVAATREKLAASGLPWIIENVNGAPLVNPVVLCGASLELTADDVDGRRLFLRRHRAFESPVLLLVPPCACRAMLARGYTVGGVYGGGSSAHVFRRAKRHGGYRPGAEVRRRLMGIGWGTRDEIAQAIPPAYTELLGRQLLAAVHAAS